MATTGTEGEERRGGIEIAREASSPSGVQLMLGPFLETWRIWGPSPARRLRRERGGVVARFISRDPASSTQHYSNSIIENDRNNNNDDDPLRVSTEAFNLHLREGEMSLIVDKIQKNLEASVAEYEALRNKKRPLIVSSTVSVVMFCGLVAAGMVARLYSSVFGSVLISAAVYTYARFMRKLCYQEVSFDTTATMRLSSCIRDLALLHPHVYFGAVELVPRERLPVREQELMDAEDGEGRRVPRRRTMRRRGKCCSSSRSRSWWLAVRLNVKPVVAVPLESSSANALALNELLSPIVLAEEVRTREDLRGESEGYFPFFFPGWGGGGTSVTRTVVSADSAPNVSDRRQPGEANAMAVV